MQVNPASTRLSPGRTFLAERHPAFTTTIGLRVQTNTLSNTCGHWDMAPLTGYYPVIERCFWEKPQYYELLSRAIRCLRPGRIEELRLVPREGTALG